MVKWLTQYFIELWKRVVNKAKEFSFPGFGGIPLYDVVVFFFRGIIKGALTTRASAIAFSFFLAIFPSIIFIFTLIPYIPISNFQEQLLELLKGLIPSNAFSAIESTLVEVVTRKSGGLLSFGFIAALFFSTNGVNSLIGAFNATYHVWMQQL